MTHVRFKDTNWLKVKWDELYHANNNRKKAGVAKLIRDKIDFNTSIIIRDKEEHSKMIKGSIHQEDVTIIHAYAPKNRSPKYMKQQLTDLKGEIEDSTTIVGNLNTPFLLTDRKTTQNISKDIEALNNTINQLHLIDIYRTLHPVIAEYTMHRLSTLKYTWKIPWDRLYASS